MAVSLPWPSSYLSFILTSMGELCEEGHELLRMCRKRNPDKPKHPTARIVSQLGGKADDRAEAPTGGLCRTASWVHEKP